MKHDKIATANAAGITAAAVYVVCRILVGLFPDASFVVAQSWFHGVEIQKLGAWSLTWESFFTGLISISMISWLLGWCFAHCYNWFVKK